MTWFCDKCDCILWKIHMTAKRGGTDQTLRMYRLSRAALFTYGIITLLPCSPLWKVVMYMYNFFVFKLSNCVCLLTKNCISLFKYGKSPKISNALFHTFWLKFCFLFSYFLKHLVNGKQCRPWSGAVWFGSALFVYIISSGTLVYKILGLLPHI